MKNEWICGRCGVTHHVGPITGQGHRPEPLKCPDCGIKYECAVREGVAVCHLDQRPSIGGLYRQGKCRHCGVPIFGYTDEGKDECGCHD